MIKACIFDFNRTLYNPENESLNPGALDLLHAMKHAGIRLFLISRQSQSGRRAQIRKLQLDSFFETIVVLSHEKTPTDFLQCIQISGLLPEEFLVLGDRVKSEITIGNQLKMKTIWYRSGKFSGLLPSREIEHPDWIVDDFRKIFEILHLE